MSTSLEQEMVFRAKIGKSEKTRLVLEYVKNLASECFGIGHLLIKCTDLSKYA